MRDVPISQLVVLAILLVIAVYAIRKHPVGVGAVLLLSPAVLAFGPWTMAVVRCGHQPVSLSSFAAADSYQLPGDPHYARFWFLHDGWDCSEKDAIRHGFHR
jgi:hypothetical protein